MQEGGWAAPIAGAFAGRVLLPGSWLDYAEPKSANAQIGQCPNQPALKSQGRNQIAAPCKPASLYLSAP